MNLKIIDVNLYNDKDWLFKLTDDIGVIYYILDKTQYQYLNITSPVSKKHLDYFHTGLIIDAEIGLLSDRNVVISINE